MKGSSSPAGGGLLFCWWKRAWKGKLIGTIGAYDYGVRLTMLGHGK